MKQGISMPGFLLRLQNPDRTVFVLMKIVSAKTLIPKMRG
jgi:hypothetical protein